MTVPKYLAYLIGGFCLEFIAVVADSAADVYTGPLHILASHVDIRVQTGELAVAAQYDVTNGGKVAQVVSIASVQAGIDSKPSNPQRQSLPARPAGCTSTQRTLSTTTGPASMARTVAA